MTVEASNLKQGKLINFEDVAIGNKIREARTEANFTLKGMSESLGVTYQQFQKYERGTNRISAKMLFKLANITNKPLDWFMSELNADNDNATKDENLPSEINSAVDRIKNYYNALNNDSAKSELLSLVDKISA